MTLTHNPSSGLIKQDGAVIGVITRSGNKFVFDQYTFKRVPQLSATSIKLLLPKIKKALTEQ